MSAAWIFEDERHAWADKVALQFDQYEFVVPTLWFYEVGNLVRQGTRRGRLTAGEADAALDRMLRLPLMTDGVGGGEHLGEVLTLASRHDLTFYDATYLELARRHGLPLATLDRELVAAANAEGLERLPN